VGFYRKSSPNFTIILLFRANKGPDVLSWAIHRPNSHRRQGCWTWRRSWPAQYACPILRSTPPTWLTLCAHRSAQTSSTNPSQSSIAFTLSAALASKNGFPGSPPSNNKMLDATAVVHPGIRLLAPHAVPLRGRHGRMLRSRRYWICGYRQIRGG